MFDLELEEKNESIYGYSIDNEKTKNHDKMIFGIRELSLFETSEYCLSSSSLLLKSVPVRDEVLNVTCDYSIRVYLSGCYYLNENNQWKSDGLIVGHLTNHFQTQCYSTHLTTFASGFIVLPTPINWNYVFANGDFIKNQSIYISLIVVCLIYIFLMIYSRHKDRKDVEKLGVSPLSDNHRLDGYFYQMILFTGHRKDSGTKSKVYFILSGDDDETKVRHLNDSKRTILQRGGIDSFIMAVPK